MKNVVIKIFVVLTLVFAYIITSRTPMMWEDVVYTLKADAALGAAMSNSSVADTLNFERYNRVADVEDLVTSSYYHYMNANGRLFPHMTSQTFGALIGKPLFDVLNALMFVLLICVVTYLVTNTRKDYWRWWVVVLSALWFLLPATNTCFFLMTYALNYLWSSVLCISFLLLYQYSSNRQQSLLFIFLGCLFSFGAGWSHEGIAVGIAAGVLFDVFLLYRSGQRNDYKLALALSFCLGAAFLCLSPGIFTRTDAALPLYNHLLSFARLRVFWLFLLCWCIFSRRVDYIRDNRLLLVALCVQTLFMFYVGYRSSRVLWGTEFFSIILLLKIFVFKESRRIILSVVSSICMALLILHFGWLTYRSGEVRKQYDAVISLYMRSVDGQVKYDINPECGIVSNFIPTPLCSYNPFEQFTFSLYYTHNKKQLEIVPDSSLNTEPHE